MLDLKSKQTDPVQEVRQVQSEKKQAFLGRIQPHKGHIIFEVNLKDHTIVPATYETQTASFEKESGKKSNGFGIQEFKDGTKKLVLDGPKAIPRKLIRKPDCTYIPALNKKNVIKKLVKKGIIKIVKK